MVMSKAKTVAEYLAELTPERREAVEVVRKVILDNVPAGYEETMQYGMISYVVPLKRYPAGYLGKADVPLCYAGLAAQKNYISLYLMNIYGDKKAEAWFKEEYKKSGKKLDMGKSCVRFKKLEDVPLDVIGEAIARTSIDDFIAQYERARKK